MAVTVQERRAGCPPRSQQNGRERAPRGHLARMLWRQAVIEWKLYWRNRSSWFSGFVLPLLFLLFLGLLNRDSTAHGYRYIDFFLPGMLAFVVIVTALTLPGVGLPLQRDQHILKRLRATPLPTAIFLGGKLLLIAILALLKVALLGAVGRLVFDASVPRDLAAVALTLLVGAAVFSALGFAIGSLIPGGEAAWAIVTAVYVPMVFLGGVFFPIDTLPASLKALTQALPSTHLLVLLRGVFLEGRGVTDYPQSAVVLGLWFVAALGVSLRTFRWVDEG
jgi:ABC-2 type transport system permease protein